MIQPHPYTGSCRDCGTFVKRPLIICFECLKVLQRKKARP